VDPVSLVALGGLDIFGILNKVLWHVLRVGAVFQAMPVIGGASMPRQARLVLAIAIAGALSTFMPEPPEAAFDAITVLAVVRELAVGIGIGLILKLAFEAGRIAGELASQSMALSMAQMADPANGSSSTVLAQWFYITFGLLFFAFDGHLAVVVLLVDSYALLPIGTQLPDTVRMAGTVPEFFGTALRAGVLLALPVMLALLTVNVSFGVLAKASPSLNPIQLGLPVALLVGVFLMVQLFGQLESPVRGLFDSAFVAARELVR
jgi:flagellar biosynthetic protein FliR